MPKDQDDEGPLLGRITIERRIINGEDAVGVWTEDAAGESLALIEALGMVEIAKDTIKMVAAGEAPDT